MRTREKKRAVNSALEAFRTATPEERCKILRGAWKKYPPDVYEEIRFQARAMVLVERAAQSPYLRELLRPPQKGPERKAGAP